MSEALNIRYQGNVISIPNNSEFNPESYGISEINIKINSQSIMKLGLTTNTEALSYCNLKLKLGNKDAYIGRKSNITYVSGNPVDYKGSTSVSREQSINTAMYTNGAGSGSFTSGGTISKNKTATNNTGSTVTTNTGQSTAMYTNGAGSGSFTSNGTISKNRIITNNTGSTVTTNTGQSTAMYTNGAGSGSFTSGGTISKNKTATNNTGSTVTTNTGQSTASGTDSQKTGQSIATTNTPHSQSVYTVTNNTGSTVYDYRGNPKYSYLQGALYWTSCRKYTNITYKGSWTSCRKNTATTYNGYWTSCRKNTATTYNGYWTSCKKNTSSTTLVTETCHNFNI